MAVATAVKQARLGFCVNATSADASGTETVVAAVANQSHYIDSITINCASAITVTVQDNTGTPVVIVGPVTFTTAFGVFTVNYLRPIQVASGKSIDIDASGAGAVCVVIQGRTSATAI